ncbi:minor core protein [Scaphoideus titanus reo-like virus 1]|nr:minor core protein [Scaphoideus titanus reo-like virus 1]
MEESDFCIPNFSQTIDKRTIINVFEACRYRSPLVVVCLSNHTIALKFGTLISMGSGSNVYYIRDGEVISQALYNVFRSISTQLLLGNQIVVFVTAPKTVLSSNTIKAITWAFRGAFVELRNHDATETKVQDRLNNLVELSPLYNVPHCGLVYYGPTVFSELLSLTKKNKTKWYATIDYSMYSRTVLVGFSKVMLRETSRLNNSILVVVGYNPPYVWASLRHGLKLNYIEIGTKSPGGQGPRGLILPKLPTDTEANKVKYVVHNPQLKLLCQDMTMLSISKNVLYIGSYPAKHLEDLHLEGWTLVCVDPKITNEWKLNLASSTKAKVHGYDQAFDFKSLTLPNYVSHFNGEKFVIIDDTWIQGDEEYESFQAEKQKYFEWAVSTESNKVILAMMKWNRKTDVIVSKLLGLLPQPYGANVHELRAIFHRNGSNNMSIKLSTTNEYLDKFAKLSTSSQISTQTFLHQLLTTTKDILNYEQQENSVIVASYSLSNANNSKAKVLAYLKDVNFKKRLMIFGAPNLNRLKFMKEVGLILDSHIVIKEDVITFKNPTGKIWKDIGYNAVELLQAGFVEVTIDQMAAMSFDVYRGCGYYANSNYNDIFSWYIPIWYIDRFMLLQDITTSPANVVKCFTTRIRNLCFVPHKVYYAYRAHLVGSFFSKHNITNNKYALVGDSKSTCVIKEDFEVTHACGPLVFRKDAVINVSGHLLSLGIAAHFVASPVYLWVRQMKYMTQTRSMKAGIDPLLYFDNKLDNLTNVLKIWHTREEVLLASEILVEYVEMMLNGHHSFGILSEIKQTVESLFKM